MADFYEHDNESAGTIKHPEARCHYIHTKFQVFGRRCGGTHRHRIESKSAHFYFLKMRKSCYKLGLNVFNAGTMLLSLIKIYNYEEL
jgi:hypothetical protein